MELRHLRYFVVAAEERHITRAAARLGIQQPPLSVQLLALEKELGVRLLERTPRGVEPTEAGLAFLEDARAILASVGRAAERAAQVARGRVGRLSVGFTTSSVLHPFVPRLLRAFRMEYEAVTLDLQEDNAAALTRAVQSGDLAAMLLRMPVERPADLVFLELLTEDMVVAAPADHRRAGGGVLRLAELREEGLILVRRPGAPGLYGMLIEACRAAGFEPRIEAEVPHMLTAVNLVAAGVGFAVVPGSMREIGMEGVRYLRLVEPVLRAPLTLGFAAANRSVLLENFRAAAVRLAPDGQPAVRLAPDGEADGQAKP